MHKTVLHIAVMNDNIEIVATLLSKKGINTEIIDNILNFFFLLIEFQNEFLMIFFVYF